MAYFINCLVLDVYTIAIIYSLMDHFYLQSVIAFKMQMSVCKYLPVGIIIYLYLYYDMYS